MHKFFLLFLFFSKFSFGQENVLPKVEVYYGMELSRPVSLRKDITFQSGIVADLGVRYNLPLQKDRYIKVGIAYSREVLNVEGYFLNNNNHDDFIITQANVKVNALESSPVALSVGYQKVYNKTKSLGFDLEAIYRGSIDREYKIGSTKVSERYVLNRKMTIGVSTLFGVILPTKKPLRIDFVLGYSLLSLASNTRFDPLNAGIRLSGGFGKL